MYWRNSLSLCFYRNYKLFNGFFSTLHQVQSVCCDQYIFSINEPYESAYNNTSGDTRASESTLRLIILCVYIFASKYICKICCEYCGF